MAIAKVEPLTTARALRGPFDYLLPERLNRVGVGSVLLVPFGRRRVIGVVVDIAESSELAPDRLAEPIEALRATGPAYRARELELARLVLDLEIPPYELQPARVRAHRAAGIAE